MPREPATWSTRDRVVYHRRDAAYFRHMAEAATCSAARDLLVDLARRYRQLASSLEKEVRAAAA